MALKKILMLALTLTSTQVSVASAEIRQQVQPSASSVEQISIKQQNLLPGLVAHDRSRTIARINLMRHARVVIINAATIQPVRTGQPAARVAYRNEAPFVRSMTVRF